MQRRWSPFFEIVRIPGVYLPGNGAAGCKLSHQMVANHFLETEHLIPVLEDDAVPTTHFKEIGMDCIADARKYIDEWRIVNLGPYLDVTIIPGLGRANLKPTKSKYFLGASYSQQTHFMLYNRKSIPILQEALRSSLPLDIYIGRMLNEVWVPIRLLATQDDSPSDIPKPNVNASELYTISERMLEDAIFSRAWWPRCAKCNKLVDRLESVPLPTNPTSQQRAVRYYIVECHGEIQKKFVGIWAADEIARKGTRLPDAFCESVNESKT